MLVSRGNRKIGKDTLILNLHTATDCAAKDMCLLRNVCYAWSNERIRPTVLAFRKRQDEIWRSNPASYFIEEFKKLKRGDIRYIRFQEAGDFEGQADLDKLSEIAEGLTALFYCYTYTCRYDLDFSHHSNNLIISGSEFMVDNMYVPLKTAAYNLLLEESPHALRCPGDCRHCTLCKTGGQKIIYQKMH